MIENGAPIETVKELLGHVSLNTTMQYVKLTNQKIRSDYNKYMSS
jgi:site-specific recombinase XerD